MTTKARVSVASTAAWRNRITGSGEEAPEQLLANPANWRIHPKAQQDALAGALDQVGWVQQVLVNRRSGFVVDGHARVALALSRGEATVPVLYVDLEPEEEALVLATLDPISAMAGRDEDGRQTLATALFARTDVLGFERMEYELTPDAIELGLGAALPAVFEIGKEREFGRGERRQTTLRHLNVPVRLPLQIVLTGAERWIRGATA